MRAQFNVDLSDPSDLTMIIDAMLDEREETVREESLSRIEELEEELEYARDQRDNLQEELNDLEALVEQLQGELANV